MDSKLLNTNVLDQTIKDGTPHQEILKLLQEETMWKDLDPHFKVS